MIERSEALDCWFVRVECDRLTIKQMRKWCHLNVALNDGDCRLYGTYAWSYQLLGNNNTSFTFGREQDALRFVLTWL